MDRLKINGMVLPDSYVERGSYHLEKEDRVIDSYTDADLIDHEIIGKHKRAIITFNLAEHGADKHDKFVRFIEETSNVEVEYYDDYKMQTSTGNFRLTFDGFSHYRKVGDNIRYNTASVTLREY